MGQSLWITYSVATSLPVNITGPVGRLVGEPPSGSRLTANIVSFMTIGSIFPSVLAGMRNEASITPKDCGLSRPPPRAQSSWDFPGWGGALTVRTLMLPLARSMEARNAGPGPSACSTAT